MDMEVTPASIPLRITGPEFDAEAWPCIEDLLERHKEIENLSPVLLNAQAPLVFALDALWGGGKTTFIKLWSHYLKHEGKASLYLNAWRVISQRIHCCRCYRRGNIGITSIAKSRPFT